MKDEPAFPQSPSIGRIELQLSGIRRELFAAMAMQGLLSGVYSSKEMLNEFTKKEYSPSMEGELGSWRSGCDAISRNAVHYADALIKELEKG